jgi:hypothetical protein
MLSCESTVLHRVPKAFEEVVWRKFPDKWYAQDRLLHLDRVLGYTLPSIQQFLTKNNTAVVLHPPVPVTFSFSQR